MDFLLRLIGTVIGFSVVMLACSLLVMAAVRLLHALANRRAKTMGEMLGAVINGYRASIGDQVELGDEQQMMFVLDVLTHRLQLPRQQLVLDPSRTTTAEGAVVEAAVAARGEQVRQADLTAIVRALAVQGKLPANWFRSVPASQLWVKPFIDYIETNFAQNERRTTAAFRREAERLSIVLSCFVVVVVNLDSLELAGTLWNSADSRSVLADAVPGLLEMEGRYPGVDEVEGAGFEDERHELVDGIKDDLVQLNSILGSADLNLGWQHGRITRVFCDYQARCGRSEPVIAGGVPWDPAPFDASRMSLLTLCWELGRWLLSLGMSAWLVSLGAPFWADLLRSILTRAQGLVPRPNQPAPVRPAPSTDNAAPPG